MRKHADNPDSDEMRQAEAENARHLRQIRQFTPEQLATIARIQAEEEEDEP